MAALTVALSLAAARPARAGDDWLGRDKGLHAAASAVIAAGAYGASAPWIESRRGRAAVGASVALAAGLAKEAWDAAGHGDPSLKDLTWDVIGTAAGVGVALLVDTLIHRRARASAPGSVSRAPRADSRTAPSTRSITSSGR